MKGIVMETHGKKAAVLLKDGTFLTVRGSFAVGDTIAYHERKPHAVRRWMAAAAAAVVLLGAGGFWYDAKMVAYAEVSLDVNPSIVYTVNKQSQVLEVRAGNNNAVPAVETLNREGVRFMPVSEAIGKTIGILGSEGYMDMKNEDYVLVNISADGERMQESLTAQVEAGMDYAREQNPTMEFRIDHSDRDTARRAAENHMSPGRYAAWKAADDGSEPETYADKPVQEIMLGRPENGPEMPPEEPPAPDHQPMPTNPSPPKGQSVPEDQPVSEGGAAFSPAPGGSAPKFQGTPGTDAQGNDPSGQEPPQKSGADTIGQPSFGAGQAPQDGKSDAPSGQPFGDDNPEPGSRNTPAQDQGREQPSFPPMAGAAPQQASDPAPAQPKP